MQPHSFLKNFPALFILLSSTTTLVMTKLVLTGVSHCHSFIANKIILGLFITGRPKEDQEFRYCFLTSKWKNWKDKIIKLEMTADL